MGTIKKAGLAPDCKMHMKELISASLDACIFPYICLVTLPCPTLCNSMDCSLPSPLSMKFSRQEYWNGLLFPSPVDLPDPGLGLRIKPESPALQADSLPTEPLGKP